MKFKLNIHSISENDSIKSALFKINKSGIRGVIVLNKKKKN